MRIAVISDIHANLPALDAVLGAVAAEGVDQLWCLGDLVGYGPHPNECVGLVRDRASICLVGNHDLAVVGRLELDLFGGAAGAAARWTRTVLDDDARTFLVGLEPTARAQGVALAHGSPRDPVWEYVLTDATAKAAFASVEEPLVLVGHSHVALAVAHGRRGPSGGPARSGTEVALDTGRHLLNPGSVGQPRDGDPRAAWLVIDTEAARATFRRTVYPVEQTQAAMREVELPELLVTRLAHGA
jgi:predicted phosphodiesterase